jgi:ProP effector
MSGFKGFDHAVVPLAGVRLTFADAVCGNIARSEKFPQRIALRLRHRNNILMPGRPPNPITKPVVVLRKRTRPKSPVQSPAAKPAVAKPPPVATAIRATSTRPPPPVASPPSTPEYTSTLKPSLPPEDPAVIAARRTERIAATQAVLKEIMERWPQTFSPHPLPVRPLATGTGQVIAAQLPEVSKTLVHQAIAFWQRQRKTPYLQALIAGGPRYDLDGNPQGEVTPEQQERARKDLVAWQVYRQEKRRGMS